MQVLKFAALGVFVFLAIWWLIPLTETRHQSSTYLDLHVHTAGLGYGDSGAFINEAMRSSIRFPIYLAAMGVTQTELETHGDALVITRIAEAVRSSRRVGQAVLLAMDGVIDPSGELDAERTQVFVPNDFVALNCSRHNTPFTDGK